MPYLIDADWLIDYLAGDPTAIALLDPLIPAGVAVSIITYTEAYQGTLRSPGPSRAADELDAFLGAAPLLPYSVDVARRCARLREDLKARGKRARSRALDLLIAATALHYDLTLVTRNRADYDDIPDLQLFP